MALANITNNILTDSGVLVSSLQGALTLTTTGSSGASTLIGNTLNIPNYGGGLTGYVPYTGATGSVNLGTNDLTSRYLVANGSAGLGGVLNIKQDAAYSPLGNGFSSIASSSNSFDFFGYTGASTYKNFQLRFDGLTNNTVRTYTLPDASGTIALTSALSGMVTGTGTTNYLPKFTGTSTIGNSQIFDNGTNLGIGTATPSGKLTINSTGDNNIRLENGSELAIVRVLTSGALDIWSHGDTANEIQFRQGTGSGSVKMMLDASGNLGLGVTPSAWSPKTLQIGSTSIFEYGTNNSIVASNFYYPGGASNLYMNNGFASFYQQYNGQHAWYNAPSGTAGNAISFTQAMTLLANGRLLVNTTSDSGNYSIQANGNIASINSSAAGLFTVSGTRSIGIQSFAGDWNYLRSNGANLVFGTQDANTLYIRTSDVDRLTIASTGAATFSSRVNVNGAPDDADIAMTIKAPSGTGKWILFGRDASDVARFQVSSAGAGIFSSSVTANGLYANAGNNARFYRSANDYYWSIHNDTNNFLNFGTFAANGTAYGSNPKMILQDNGNVGIGTTSPIYKFEVSDGTRTGVFNPNSALDGFFIGTYQAKPLIFGTGDTERMRITSGGNVGIGVTSVNGLLSLKANKSNTPILRFQNQESGPDSAISTYTSSTQTYTLIGHNIYVDSSGNAPRFNTSYASCGIAFDEGDLRFLTGNSSGSASSKLTIASTGAATFSSSIQTGAPSGGTAQPWKLGTVYTGTCVPNSFGDFTSWFTGTVIEIEVNGTTYKIPAVIDNYC